MPANGEQTRRDAKSATPCEHGSIGENGADIVCGTNWVDTAPGQNPGPPPRLALVEKCLSYSQVVTTVGCPRVRGIGLSGLSPNRMAHKWLTVFTPNNCERIDRRKTSRDLDTFGRQSGDHVPEALSHSAFPGCGLVVRC
jgi:hypothetical protein